MGVLSDLVLAADADIPRIADSSVPSEEFDGIDVKGVDTIKLGMLHSLLTGRDFEELLPEYDPVHEASSDGPWVFRVPRELTTGLVNLTDSEFENLVDRWASTEEFELDGAPREAVAEVLREIQTLARAGVASSREMFLWMSL
jgi:hypothetical protein